MKRFLITFLLLSSSAALADQSNWINLLQSDVTTIEQRARACQRLGEAGADSEEVIPALATLLNDPVINTYARTALERIGSPNARKALHAALPTTKGVARIGVIQSLGSLRVNEAIPDLTKLVSEQDENIAEAALLALGHFPGDEVTKVIVGHLDHSSERRRRAAATACLLAAERVENANHAMLLYEAVLKSDVPQSFHTGATHRLIVHRRSIPFLMEQIQSDNEAIRNTAFLALRSMASDELADTLHAKLKEAGPRLQVLLINALRDCSNAKTVPILSQILVNSEEPARQAIIDTLVHLGGETSASALLSILSEESARQALVDMESMDVDVAIASMLVASNEIHPRLQLIALLGQRQRPEALQPLLVQANDVDTEIRTAAFKALRPLVRFVEIPELIVLLKTSTGEAQGAALSAIVSACRRSASADAAGDLVLTELNKASSADARRPWVRILAAIGHAASLPVISRDLDAPNEGTVRDTIGLLGRWPNAAPVEPLFRVCDRALHRSNAVSVILKLIAKSDEFEQRLKWLVQAQPFVKSRSEKRLFIATLGGTTHPGAIELVRPFLEDESVAKEAEAALKSLSDTAK